MKNVSRNVALTFESVDEKCYCSNNETSVAELSRGTICFVCGSDVLNLRIKAYGVTIK